MPWGRDLRTTNMAAISAIGILYPMVLDTWKGVPNSKRTKGPKRLRTIEVLELTQVLQSR